jgi:hypothetical protein
MRHRADSCCAQPVLPPIGGTKKWITCDRCGSDTSGEITKHVVVYAIGSRRNVPRLEFCLDCGDALCDLLDEFGADVPETREQKRQREHEEHLARSRAWKATAGEQCQRLILEALGADQLTLSQIAKRLTERYRDQYGGIFESTLRNEVRNMLIAGELDRLRADLHNKPRYVYFRKPGLDGPIADLEAQLADEREA